MKKKFPVYLTISELKALYLYANCSNKDPNYARAVLKIYRVLKRVERDLFKEKFGEFI
jgi:hypothetical protein